MNKSRIHILAPSARARGQIAVGILLRLKMPEAGLSFNVHLVGAFAPPLPNLAHTDGQATYTLSFAHASGVRFCLASKVFGLAAPLVL